MSTLTLTAQPGVASQIATIKWMDAGFDNFNTNMRVKAATTNTQVGAIGGAADAFSQAHICEIDLAGLGYDVSGEDAATDLQFARRTDYVEFEFRSPAFCSARAIVQVPSPLELVSDGTNPVSIFSDVAKRQVNLNHPAISLFTGLVAAQLADSKYNVTDWVAVNAERVTTAVAYRGKAAS